MDAEVYYRNPRGYIMECMEVGVKNFIWDRSVLIKWNLDMARLMELYFVNEPWRVIVTGRQGACEYTHESPRDPVAVYPVWEYGDDIGLLEEMLEQPVGEDTKACSDLTIPKGIRPVLGQPHKVLIMGAPATRSHVGRAFMNVLRSMQDENPEATIHVHGFSSFRYLFGLGFKSVDFDPYNDARHGQVDLPMGKVLEWEQAAQYPQWINLLGFSPRQLDSKRNRVVFNILSAEWARKHYREQIRFKSSGWIKVDPDAPDVPLAVNRRIFVKNIRPREGDRFLCDVCSLQLSCKLFRTGAICVVPESEPKELAHYFKTRDSDVIIEGLGTLLAAETRRLSRGLEIEEMDGTLNPEVTKIIHKIFADGVKLAKLVDPKLRGGPAVNVKFTQNQATINASSPQQLMAAMVSELEGRGIPRAAITPEIVMGILETPEDIRQRAIDAAVAENA